MLRQTITSLLIGTAALSAVAVPAKPGILSYPQPNGELIAISLHGDEHASWYETSDGYILLPDASGELQYATLDAGRLVSTGICATSPELRTPAQKAMLAKLDCEQMRKVAGSEAFAASVAARAPRRVAADTGLINNYPKTGSPKVMVLLVEFEDVHFSTENAHQAFTDLATKPGYSHGGASGSSLDYFTEQSNGIFTPDFQVFGPIRVPHPESYYGAQQGAFVRDAQAWKMVTDAAEMLHEEQPDLDWSQFDNDKDGFVDSIFIFYAGYGQNEGAPSWTIWPHSANVYTFYNIEMEFNGVLLGNYACTNELKDTSGTVRTGIGTMCHEYSHVLGLPDYYRTDGATSSSTPGPWDIMDSGSYNNEGNTPPNYSAYSRFCLGWLNPRELTAGEDVTLNPIKKNEARIITTDKAEEYFVIENRQKEGWDTYLPGHGMLVWHIDFDSDCWINNKVNNDLSHQRVDLVEADNIASDGTRNGDPFPGSNNVREFSATTVPAMKCWSGYELDMPLTDIHEAEGIITFKAKGGGDVLAPVQASAATDVTPVSFKAHWSQGQGAYKYEVDVCRTPTVVPFLTLQVDGATSVEVTGLDSETEYSYVVRAVSDDRKSVDSNRVTVKTLEATFEQKQVKVLEAADVTDASFTARWEELPGAAAYYINVVEKAPVNPTYQTIDFTKDASGNFLPEGWNTTSTTTGSLKGYYGESAPSLRLSNSSDRLTSPTFTDEQGDISHFSFWYRGNGTGDDSALAIEAMVDGKWTPVHTITPVDKSEGHTFEMSPEAELKLPQGAKAVRVTFSKEGNGSVYLDDVKLGYGATYISTPLADYKDLNCGKATSAKVSGLLPLVEYYYTVRAEDANGISTPASKEVKVVTTQPGAIGTIESGDGFLLRALPGVIEVQAAPGIRVKMYDAAGLLEATGTTDSRGLLRLPASSGLHLIAPFGRKIRN